MPIKTDYAHLKFIENPVSHKRYEYHVTMKHKFNPRIIGVIKFTNIIKQFCYIPIGDHYHSLKELLEIESFMIELSKEKEREDQP